MVDNSEVPYSGRLGAPDEKLKPCPFCGAAAVKTGYGTHTTCSGMNGPCGMDKFVDIETWNRREHAKEIGDIFCSDNAKWNEFLDKVMTGQCICEGTIIKKERCPEHGDLWEAREINGIMHFILREIYSKEIEEQSPHKLTGKEKHDTAHKRIDFEINETLRKRKEYGMEIHCDLPVNTIPPDFPWGPVNAISDVKVDGKPVEPLPDSMKSSAKDNVPLSDLMVPAREERQMIEVPIKFASGTWPVCCNVEMKYGPGMVYVCGKCGRKIEDEERQAKFKERGDGDGPR